MEWFLGKTYIFLESFECVSAWTDEQADEVDLGVLLLRNEHLIDDFCGWRSNL